MKKEFTDYLKEIGLSSVMIDELQIRYQMLLRVSDLKEFNNIFISELITKEGIREYFSLWGFTSTLFCKMSIRPQTEDKIVLFRLKNNIARFTINDFNYDLATPNETSFLNATIRTFDMDIPYLICASGINCKYLIEISRHYLILELNR